jgi:hypothetical protein
MKTIIDQTSGKVLYSIIDGIEIDLIENEMIIEQMVTENYENTHYDFEKNIFYNLENAN